MEYQVQVSAIRERANTQPHYSIS